MKKKIIAIILMVVILIITFMIATGFRKREDVVLFDYSISENGTVINLGVQVSSSMGYIRGFKNNGGGVKPHYLTFYSTCGGLNSSFGTVNSFTLEIDSDDTEIYFNRPNGGYELVLVKDEETGEWIKANKILKETITYNGKEYEKAELCNDTLKWLELSEEERTLSSYFPPEFMKFDEKWGVSLTVENLTSSGATIKCIQSGGEPTGELHTGSWYILENWTQENGWKEMPYVIDGEIGWNDIAWIIPMEDTVELEVNWEWLYGKLPVGKYRIGKSITDFRETGDYDTATYFVEFKIVK